MTEQEAAEWQERLAAMVARNIQRKAIRKAERAEFARRRAHGKARGHQEKLARNRRAEQENTVTRCRYLDRFGGQCTGEPIDPTGEVLICTKHGARFIELLKAKGFTITAPAAAWCSDCKES